jgi:hypothetical protein
VIKIISQKISEQALFDLCQAHFETMVKFVVDIEKSTMAVGGELHADAETLLLQAGSEQAHLWGGNFYPWHEPKERIEYTSFINIRPGDGHPHMEIEDEEIRRRVCQLAETLLLAPKETLEPLS